MEYPVRIYSLGELGWSLTGCIRCCKVQSNKWNINRYFS